MTITTGPHDVRSRDGAWIYHRSGCGWVHAATHVPTGRHVRFRGTIAAVRAEAASGQLLARADALPTPANGKEVLLDNEDGTGWRVDQDGWAHPQIRTADGWQDTGEPPLPPDPHPHPVGIRA